MWLTYFCNFTGNDPQDEPGTTSYLFFNLGQATFGSFPSILFNIFELSPASFLTAVGEVDCVVACLLLGSTANNGGGLVVFALSCWKECEVNVPGMGLA